MKISRHKALTFLSLFLILLGGCKSKEKSELVVLTGGTKPLKSNQIFDYLDNKKENYERLVGVTLFAKVTMRDTSALVKKALQVYRKRAEEEGENNLKLVGYSKLLESADRRRNLVIHGVTKSDIELANSITDLNQQVLKIGDQLNDTTMKILAITQLSSNYFGLGKNDSAEMLTKLGFDLAYNSRDYVHIHFFGVNLGYVFNKKSMYGAAQQYFETALEAAKKVGSPHTMAVNNLVGLLVSEKNYYDAEQLWNQEFANKELDPDSYEDQVLIINKAYILQKLGKHKEAQIWIKKIKNVANYPDLQIDFHRVILNQMENEELSTSAYLDSIKSIWLAYPPDGIKKMYVFIQHALPGNSNLLSDKDIKFIDSFVDQSTDDYYDWVDIYESVKGVRAQSEGDLNEAIGHFRKALEIKELANIKDGISRKSDITEKLHIREQQAKLEESNILLEHERNSYLWYRLVTAAIILLGIFIIFIIVRERGRLKLQNDLVEKELILEKKSAEALQLENEINGRVLALSKLVIAKADRINKLLMALNENNFKDQIRELKTESLAIQNAFSEAKPQLADKLLEDYSEIQLDFPGVSELNMTEKRIFVLSINGYHSKEIGSILGLTGQYVNNARTRIRKKLDISENWNEIKINKKNPNLI
jgi:tetratricopeptide (TPR) repeat protein